MKARCALCGRRFDKPLMGRPRRFCTVCAPPGAKHPVGLSPDFPRSSGRTEQAHQMKLAREAATRQVAKADRSLYERYLAEEYRRRGLTEKTPA